MADSKPAASFSAASDRDRCATFGARLAAALAAALMLGALVGCQRKRSFDTADAAVTTTTTSVSAEEACVDRWLAARDLDAFGSPRGTVYTGGSPLFDEASGKSTSRDEFIYAKHPDAKRACGHDAGSDR